MVALNKKFVVLLAVSAFITVSFGQRISPRMLNGILADTMRRFPHHVTIQPLNNGFGSKELPMCGGSILSDQFVLTSMHCVEQGDTLQINFQKLHKNSTVGSYSAVVNNDENSVTKYPTEYDDIAIIKIPFRIIFSDKVKPIGLFSGSSAEMVKKLGVLPGFDAQKDQLTYAMLTLASNQVCQRYYQNANDEFLNMCATPNNRNTPCHTEFGNGLVVGWPAKPELIGIYSSTSNDCENSTPSVFTNIRKYEPWINDVMGKNQPETAYYTTTMDTPV